MTKNKPYLSDSGMYFCPNGNHFGIQHEMSGIGFKCLYLACLYNQHRDIDLGELERKSKKAFDKYIKENKKHLEKVFDKILSIPCNL